MIPETKDVTEGRLSTPTVYKSVMDAVTKGTVSGIDLMINIVAMIIVLVAMVSLINMILGLMPLLNGHRITSYNVCYTKLLRFPTMKG